MAIVTTITKSVLKRGWLEIEPKLLAVLAGLATSTALIAVAHLFGYNLDPTIAVPAAGLLSLIIGYLKTSPAPTFPVAAAVKDAADIVAAVDPAIAPQVAEVQSIIAPAFDTAAPETPAVSDLPVVTP